MSMEMKRKELNDKERKFVFEYMVDYDGKRACIAAGYGEKSASVTACKLLKKPMVQRLITKLEMVDIKRLGIERDEVLLRLYYLVTRDALDYTDHNGRLITDVTKLPPRARAAIDQIKQKVYVDSEGNEHIETELKLASIVGALDMAMKHKMLYAPVQVEVGEKPKTLNWDQLYERDSGPDMIETELVNPPKEGDNGP